MVERRTFDYVGSGTGTFSGSASDIKLTNSEIGSGSLFIASGSAESRTADPADGTVLYTFSGREVSLIRAPIIGSGVITLNNDPVDVKITSTEEGSGKLFYLENLQISGFQTIQVVVYSVLVEAYL